MGWENQYMQLVTTKPGVIIAEHDREFSAESRSLLKPNGFFRYKTDHHEYFSSVKSILPASQ